MFTEILSCLALFNGDIDYGTPNAFSEIQIIQDSQRTDIFYVSNQFNNFRCVSSIPLNQNVQIYFPKVIQGLPQKVQYVESAIPRAEVSQKVKKQVYKLSENKLFKHEKINLFTAPVYSELKATATCDLVKNNATDDAKHFETSLLKSVKLEISDSLADWSDYMDSEDYGYDKTSKEREKSKKIYTEKLKNNLLTCQKYPDLNPATRSVIEKLDLYLNPTGLKSINSLDQKTQLKKTSVPANN